MDCAIVQRHLSQYMDGVLDAQKKDEIEKHLSSCKDCQSELESLETLVQNLGAFNPVKAPDDFLEQLHRRMDTRFDLKRFFQGLAMPFRTRIPMQLAAAAAMAVLIFAIVYVPQIKKDLPDTAVDTIQEVPEEQEEQMITASKPMKLKTQISTESAPQFARSEHLDVDKQDVQVTEEMAVSRESRPITDKVQPELESTARLPASLPKASTPKAPMPAAPMKAVPMPTSAKTVPQSVLHGEIGRIELTLLLQRTDIKAKGPHAYSMKAQTTPVPEDKQARTLGAATPKKSDDVALKDKKTVDYMKKETAKEDLGPLEEPSTWILSPYEARRQVEALIEKVQGRMLNVETKNNTDMPVSIDAEIPSDQYVYFYKHLQQIGILQSPLSDISAQGTDPIQVRIRFISE